jgi:hypothetical protein
MAELEQRQLDFGPRKMLNITRETGISGCVDPRYPGSPGARNRYSTVIHAVLADAADDRRHGDYSRIFRLQGRIGVEKFRSVGSHRHISLVHDDAGRVLERSADSSFDFIFLDSERPEYPGWWPNIRRVLRPAGLLVVDNATSHPQEIATFIALVKTRFTTSLCPSAMASSWQSANM